MLNFVSVIDMSYGFMYAEFRVILMCLWMSSFYCKKMIKLHFLCHCYYSLALLYYDVGLEDIVCPTTYLCVHLMDLIHYSFVPLILLHVLCTLSLLPYYLSIANGGGSIGIFEFLFFQCLV